jgi:hypothetical protein
MITYVWILIKARIKNEHQSHLMYSKIQRIKERNSRKLQTISQKKLIAAS